MKPQIGYAIHGYTLHGVIFDVYYNELGTRIYLIYEPTWRLTKGKITENSVRKVYKPEIIW